MIYYKPEAINELADLYFKLLLGYQMDGNRSFDYVADILFDFHRKLHSIVRFKCQYKTHRRYGCYEVDTKRNRTTWYAIYDIEGDDFYVNKIMTNYNTINGIF